MTKRKTAKPSNGLRAWANKMITWLERQADKYERDAMTCRFESLNEAYRADARNYRAMAEDGKRALAAVPGDGQKGTGG